MAGLVVNALWEKKLRDAETVGRPAWTWTDLGWSRANRDAVLTTCRAARIKQLSNSMEIVRCLMR